MDNISFMFCHIVISVNISNCHPSPCRLLQKKNVRFLGFQIFCMKTAQKEVQKSARFLQNLVYTQAGSYCPSCSPWNIHGLGCFCNFFGKLQPPKKLEDFKIPDPWVGHHENKKRLPSTPSLSNLTKQSHSTHVVVGVTQVRPLFERWDGKDPDQPNGGQWKVGQKLLN